MPMLTAPVVTADEAHTVSRAECLERYREKKLRRLDVNTIRYMKRKINADRRPRELAFTNLHPNASLACQPYRHLHSARFC
jgi:CCT motif